MPTFGVGDRIKVKMTMLLIVTCQPPGHRVNATRSVTQIQ